MSRSPLKCYDKYGAATATAFGGSTSSWDTTVGVAQPGGNGTNIPNCGWLTDVPNVVSAGGVPALGTRTGTAVHADSLHVRFRITPDTGTTFHAALRILLVLDRQCDGVYPAVADLLGQFSATSPGTLGPAPILCFLDQSYIGRFQILKDELFQFCPLESGNTGTVNQMGTLYEQWIHEWNVDLKSLGKDSKIMFNAGSDSTTIGDARNNHLFIFAFWEYRTQAAGVTSTSYAHPPLIDLYSRLRFSDIPL